MRDTIMHYFKPYIGVITDETPDAIYISFAGKRTRISKPASDGITVQAVLLSRQYRDLAVDGPYRVHSVYQSVNDAINTYKGMDVPLNRIRVSGSGI